VIYRNPFAVLALLAVAACALPVQAQSDWPTKPVRILTPFPAGAGPEAIARMVADRLGKMWGKPVVVENRPGANGFLAIDAFKRGDKDGYDLIQLDNVHLTAYPSLFKKLPYDPQKDFDPLVPLFKANFFFTVATDSPFKSVGDIIAAAKAQPGKLNYGSWSVGNPVHLGSQQFAYMTGTQMEHVIYKETSMLYAGVATGELAFSLGSVGTSGALQRAGRLRYLAVAGPKRLAAYPDIPTVGESGGPADFEVIGWTAFAAPKSLNPAIAEKIRRDVLTALKDPEIQARYASFGYEIYPVTGAEFASHIKAESTKLAGVIQKAHITLD
jgi:tripartite-type tricarboxylate transporter receptor subunit TctC